MKKRNLLCLLALVFHLSGTGQDKTPYHRPQMPVAPFPYSAEEVRYPNGVDTSVRLAATLTLPPGKGPFPAVLFIGGSGLFPRTSSFFGHNLEAVLADYLTRLGIATLRYDERGTGSSTRGSKNPRDMVDEDHYQDAKAGIDFLRTRKDIDLGKIGVIGGSAGTLATSRLAAELPDMIGFIVMLVPASHGLTKGQMVATQSAKMLLLEGASPEARRGDSSFIARSLYYTKNEADKTKRLQAIRQIAGEELAAMPPADSALLAKGFGIKANILASEEFHESANDASRNFLKEVKCPVLTVNGGKDVLIDAYYNVPRIRATLKESGNRDYQVELIPELNHMMQTAGTGLMEEAEHIEETISPKALRLISTWVVDHSIRYKGYYSKAENRFIYPSR